MKTRILFLAILSSVSLFGADAKPAVEIPKVESAKYNDPFLNLAYEKAKLYSDKAEGALSSAIDVAKNEAPELAKEYIKWRIAYHSMRSVVPLVCFLMCCIVIYKFKDKIEDDLFSMLMTIGGGFGLMIFGVMALCDSLPEGIKAVQAIMAPKIYIAEQLVNAVKR